MEQSAAEQRNYRAAIGDTHTHRSDHEREHPAQCAYPLYVSRRVGLTKVSDNSAKYASARRLLLAK